MLPIPAALDYVGSAVLFLWAVGEGCFIRGLSKILLDRKLLLALGHCWPLRLVGQETDPRVILLTPFLTQVPLLCVRPWR